jgi:putative peptidoglycan lipid II flippase
MRFRLLIFLERSLAKFVVAGAVLGVALWLAARLAVSYLAGLSTLRDATAFLLLVVAGSLVHAGSVLPLFGRNWLRSRVRG